MENYFIVFWEAVKGGLAVLALLTVIDIVFGVIEAVIHKKFEWQALMHFVQTDLLPILAWLVIVLLKLIPEVLLPKGYTIPVVSELYYGGLVLSIFGSIFKSWAELGIMENLFSKVGVTSKADSAVG